MSKKNTKKPAKKNVKKAVEEITVFENVDNTVETVATESVETPAAGSDKRREYAREYYKKNAEKIREASRKCHAKRNGEIKAAIASLANIRESVCSKLNGKTLKEFETALRMLGIKF